MEGKSPFTLLRELPTRPTQRSSKASTDLARASTALDLTCFSGGPKDQQLLLEAFQDTWDDIMHTCKDLQQHNVAPVLSQLQQWAAGSAQGAEQLLQSHGDQIRPMHPDTAVFSETVPTVALAVGSSMNTAETYADLLNLRQQGHPTGLVTAREAASGLAAVVNAALRQFLRSPTAADDMPALLSWWTDEWQRSYGHMTAGSQAHGTSAAGNTPATSRKGSQAAAGGSSNAQQDVSTMDVDQQTAATPKRELRTRTAPRTPLTAGKALGAPGSTGASLQAPVLVLQDADSVDAEALEELVVALHEARTWGLPVVLVLGINTSHAGLQQLLPNSIMRRIQLLQLSLPPAMQQLALFYRNVLLKGPQPRLVLGPRCAAWLLAHFRDVDASGSMSQRAVQLACVEHYRQQPLSCLAAAAASGSCRKLKAAIANLSMQQLLCCCAALLAAAQNRGLATSPAAAGVAAEDPHSSQAVQPTAAAVAAAREAQAAACEHLQAFVGHQSTGRSKAAAEDAAADAARVLEGAVWGAVCAFQRWRLGVLLLNKVASFTGVADIDASLQLPALYSAASQPSFLQVSRRGLLSACSRLLLKVLGNSICSSSTSTTAGSFTGASAGGSRANRAGVVPVDSLCDAECIQLLGHLLQLLAAARQHKQEHRVHSDSRPGANHGSAPAEAVANADYRGSDSGSSGSESDSDVDGSDSPADEVQGGRLKAAADTLAGCSDIRQLVQALNALHEAAAGSTQQQPGKSWSSTEFAFAESFGPLLVPLPDQVEQPYQAAPAAAAAAAPQNDTPDAAALGICSTPGGRSSRRGAAAAAAAAAAGDNAEVTPQMTPGGLASALRRRVRFAPDTPDHAAAKAAGNTSSAKSTPDGEAAPAVVGLIKTPNKRGSSGGGKPRKKLFDSQAAAAAAAAAGGEGDKPRRSRRKEKQRPEVGDIAGSSVAALAAVAAAADAGPAAAAALSKAGAAPVGNKRHARLMGMMANNLPGAAAADGGGGVVGGSRAARGSSSTPKAAKQQQPHAAGMLLSPTAGTPSRSSMEIDCCTSSPERDTAPCAGAAAAASAGTMAGPCTVLSPTSALRGSSRTRSSRLSRQSCAASNEASAVDMQLEQGQQQQGAGVDTSFDGAASGMVMEDDELVGGPAAAAADSAAGPPSLGVLLAQLLNAVIPRLVLDWACPDSKDGFLHAQATSRSGTDGGASSNSSSVDAAVAAGYSLAAAGASAFTFDSAELLDQCLAPPAAAAVHAALVAPGRKLPQHPVSIGQQGWEDTCLAYVLLQQQREDGMPIADWFGIFCEAQGLQAFSHAGELEDQDEAKADGADDQQAGASGAAGKTAGRARARGGRKARGYAEARAAVAGEGAAAAGDGDDADDRAPGSRRTPSRRSRKQQHQDQDENEDQDMLPATTPESSKKRTSSRAAAPAAVSGADDADDTGRRNRQHKQQRVEVDQQELLAAAARFSQAAAELQLLGVWKPTKRRRAAGVLRVFAPEGPHLDGLWKDEP